MQVYTVANVISQYSLLAIPLVIIVLASVIAKVVSLKL